MTRVLAAALPVLLALSSLAPSDLLLAGVPHTQGHPSTALPEEAQRHLAEAPGTLPPTTAPQPGAGAAAGAGAGAGAWAPSLTIDADGAVSTAGMQRHPQPPPLSADEAAPYTFGGGALQRPGQQQPQDKAAAGASTGGAGQRGCPIGGRECPFANGHEHPHHPHPAAAGRAGGGVTGGGAAAEAAVSGGAVEGIVGAALLRAPHAHLTVVPLPPLPSLTAGGGAAVETQGAAEAGQPPPSQPPPPPGPELPPPERHPLPPIVGQPPAAAGGGAAAMDKAPPAPVAAGGPARPSTTGATAVGPTVNGGTAAVGGLAGPRPPPMAALGGWSISGLVEPVMQVAAGQMNPLWPRELPTPYLAMAPSPPHTAGYHAGPAGALPCSAPARWLSAAHGFAATSNRISGGRVVRGAVVADESDCSRGQSQAGCAHALSALRVHSAATAADLAAAARLRAAAEGAAARLRQHLDSVRQQQRQLDEQRDAAAAAGDYAAAAELRLRLDGLEAEAESLEAAARSSADRLDSLTEAEGGVRAAQAAALLAAAAELRRLSATAAGALSRLQTEMAEVQARLDTTTNARRALGQALSRHSQQTDVRRELRRLALDAAAAESAAAAALAEHRAADRGVLTDAAGLVRNLTAADSLAAAAAAEAELIRGQLAVSLQMQDYDHAAALRSSLQRLEAAAAGGGGAAAAFGRLLAAHRAVVAQRLADFGHALRRLQRAGVLVGLVDDLRRIYGAGQMDARESLQLASQLAAAVGELHASAPPPAVERGQAEEIVKGLVV
ncbi:hypothetical protein HXX76_015322 [Chlamydomonas incerta]|uniref:Uncharacterized protein n=1 Tax=Chlamydomonas incerta TaxID=51695 RepID=A0A835SDD4_CHLIN|nr:hypothetical protein HXX76_015322 [Chlamydomonas incerta]|eukprot:KAG2423451.1 hypothetical protein HXX76_015322 [Chlamydomonas incerta]